MICYKKNCRLITNAHIIRLLNVSEWWISAYTKEKFLYQEMTCTIYLLNESL